MSEIIYDKFKTDMIVRVKNFDRSNIPLHWVGRMLEHSDNIYKVREKVIVEDYPHNRIRLKHLDGNPIQGTFFIPEDFQKVNSIDE